MTHGSKDEAAEGYHLRISRLTVDKLGVKLYDRASAVVAELIANAYDADAESVTISVPLGTQLDLPDDAGRAWQIKVVDDGHGMTPQEARDYYLQVGRDRRLHADQGSRSRNKKRPVMGRKGIGKLSPFGICKVIEVISSGGQQTDAGYLTTHFAMNFDDIVRDDTDEPVALDPGDLDGTWQPHHGTTIILSNFHKKRVPDTATFTRQLARRFALASPDFRVVVQDSRSKDAGSFEVPQFQIEVEEGTRVDLTHRPVVLDDGSELPVRGWLAIAKDSYKNEEMAGVRVYARGKIVATTRDFEQPAGFTGEFTLRSYLVGEVHAEWLDDDDSDDLIRTDRQAIIWESERGNALRTWGAEIIRFIGAQSRKPRRRKTRDIFMEKSKLKDRAEAQFGRGAVADAAVQLGKQIGSFAAEDELTDEIYIEGLVGVVLAVAPHQALIGALQEFNRERTGGDSPTLEDLLDLFGKSRVAEMASYAQIADERIRVLQELEEIFAAPSDEAALQAVIARAPWLVHPEWTVITQNQSLKTFKRLFEEFWKRKTDESLDLALDWKEVQRKRPDFVLVAISGNLYIVEIKASGHIFNDDDFIRLHRYVEAFREFASGNPEVLRDFGRGWRIELVADGVDIRNGPYRTAYESLQRDEVVVQMSWADFRARARKAHEQFLEAHDAVRARERELESQSVEGTSPTHTERRDT